MLSRKRISNEAPNSSESFGYTCLWDFQSLAVSCTISATLNPYRFYINQSDQSLRFPEESVEELAFLPNCILKTNYKWIRMFACISLYLINWT